MADDSTISFTSNGCSKPTYLKSKNSSRKKRKSAKKVTINVAGTHFLVLQSTLKKYPGTKLSALDPSDASYDDENGEYYFDRNPQMFAYILDFYRSGDLHIPSNVCGPYIRTELRFWGLEEGDISPCCLKVLNQYDDEIETLNSVVKTFRMDDSRENHDVRNRADELSWFCRQRLWTFLDDPTSSFEASICGFIYLAIVIVSIVTMCMETTAAFRVPSDNPIRQKVALNETNAKMILFTLTDLHPVVMRIENVCTCLFTVDVLVRFFVCPNKCKFMKTLYNIIDILCILPMWIDVMFQICITEERFWKDRALLMASHHISMIRLLRVFRLFKLAKQYDGLQVLILTLKASCKELLLLLTFSVIGSVIYASLIYYAEFEVNDEFMDIPIGFWWAIITMTTVGYGDKFPTTGPGYLVGTLCALTGLILVCLPIPIIAQNFNLYYTYAQIKRKMKDRLTRERHCSTPLSYNDSPLGALVMTPSAMAAVLPGMPRSKSQPNITIATAAPEEVAV